MSDFTDFTFKYRIPNSMSDYTMPAIENYLMHGIPPGSFLMAVLKNNLASAAMRADATNFDILGNIAMWMTFNVPVDAWGDDRRVHAWLDNKDGVRTAYATKCEQAFAWHILETQTA